ncbi:MAG TPA: glycoside hydrolase family 43 protein [Planctomycetota bacterium]|nr:glycoside hydrolase family 43 protein [Planctomycetota bacterium]
MSNHMVAGGTGAGVPRADVRLRDPYVLPLPERGEYLLFGTTARAGAELGFDCWTSRDLDLWHGPHPAFRPPHGFWGTRDFWAPEAHPWRGRWYLLASFAAPGHRRGTGILVADDPRGPYRPHSDGAVTPADRECLDGTLHVDDDGAPWLVFCHEWLQIGDGTICAVRLDEELRRPLGEPVVLFRASQAGWPVEIGAPQRRGVVTDGPFLHRAADGRLLMVWSSFATTGYALTTARSSGGILGPWFHVDSPLIADDGGHGMLFRAFDGRLLLSIHRPNRPPDERPVFLPVRESDGSLALVG